MTTTLWAACRAFVPVVMIANLAVAVVPHVRGIAFVPQLRYAVMTAACALSAIMSAFLYRRLKPRTERPRSVLAWTLLAIAFLVVMAIAITSGMHVAATALPAAASIVVVLVWLVPRFVDRNRRFAGSVATMVLGGLMVVGVVAALSGERLPPPGPSGMAFEIPRVMFDVDHRFIDLPSGARIHYVDVGRGETMLFLHGNPAWSFQWRLLIQGLRDSFRCVALDYPGFGLSSAPEGFGFTPREQSRIVEEFVDRLKLNNLTLVMHDWGGPIGLGLAGRHPELIRRIVLGNTWAWPTSAREPRGVFSKVVGGPIGEFAQMNFNGFVWMALKHDIVRRLPADVAEVYMRPFRPLERRGVAAFYPGQIIAASEYLSEVEASLPRVADRPALFSWGMQDPGFPRGDLDRFETLFPRHKTIELEGANHFFFEDAAERVIKEIAAFAVDATE